jgi:hypothetical protein
LSLPVVQLPLTADGHLKHIRSLLWVYFPIHMCTVGPESRTS